MEIFAHRGAWTRREEQNTLAAFERAWQLGVGIETDVRDLAGQLVISHDMPLASSDLMTLTDLLRAWSEAGRTGRLALNVKADGLSDGVSRELRRWGAHESAFVFDMSVPDQMAHCRAGNPVMTRWSDVEEPALLERALGLWLDAFTSDDWWLVDQVAAQADAGRDVVFVSPELHGRDHVPAWRRIADGGLHRSSRISLCTDLVAEARTFFASTDARFEEAHA